MNRTDLFAAFSEVDDDILARSEMTVQPRRYILLKWGMAAACLCLILASAAALPHSAPSDPPTVPTEDPILQSTHGHTAPTETLPPSWNAVYNEVSDENTLDAARVYIPGYFTEELDTSKIEAVLPAGFPGHFTCTATAGYDGSGNLLNIYLTVDSQLSDDPITVVISKGYESCYLLPGEPVISQCGGVAYTLYKNIDLLEAEATIGQYYFRFTMRTASEAAFEDVLMAFSRYEGGAPDLSTVTPDAIPEWFDSKISLADAWDDPAYGGYMLKEVPSGFTVESIRRYKNQHFDYLSGLWTRGYDELCWEVYTIKDTDEARITAIADKENYDLSLYPIPRAESVPESLWEIVDNPIFLAQELTMDAVLSRAYKIEDAGDSNGWRMEFSVKYGDIVIEVRTKGIDPEWLYRQLVSLRETM